MRRFVFLMMQCCVVMSVSCPADRNQDHRPRVSCVGQSLTTVPDGIDPDTQVLVLTENHFSSLSWSSYSGFTQLHELDLSHNLITTLEPPGPVLGKLSVLRLSGNRLTGLGGLVFRCAPNLMEIFLNANQIRSLHDATFSELPRLEIINLSQNKLPALPARLLERVSSSSLKTFDLENNSISLMPDSFFSSKPELPYVFLSYNPWICSCAVGYLHSYLNDQEHNVYKHVAPNGLDPAADSVVCSAPPHLSQRPIIELEENDFCPPDPPLYPSGDWDFKPITRPNYSPQTPPAPHDASDITLLPASTKSWTTSWSWVSESWSETRYEFRTMWELFSLNPKTTSEIPTLDATESPANTTQPNTMITDPYQLTTSGPITARSQSQSTIGSEPHTSRTITVQTEPPTTGPSTAGSHGQSTSRLDPHSSSATITVQTEPQTTGPIIAGSQSQSTIGSEPHTSRTITVQTEPPTTGPSTARSHGQSTSRLDPHSSTATITVQTEPQYTGPIIAGSQSQSTIGSEPHTSRTITVQTEPPTAGPSTARSHGQSTSRLDPHSSSATITVQTEPRTTGPIIAGSQGQSTSGSSRTTITVQTEPPTVERIIPRTEPPTSVGPHWADARGAGGRILPWCWWLFAGFVLLCLLSALTSCVLCVWLLRNHLTVSRWLKHHGLPRSDSGGVTLQAYKYTEHTQRREDEGERVSFIPLNQLRDVQAVFRSVLFIHPPEEQKHHTEGRDASSKVELVSVAGRARDKEREPAMSGEVFRKTLHRVISREEEADGWREEEEADRRREGECVWSGQGSTARYSLILREERGTRREMQWLVGEWELGDEGVANQRSCSLIGQLSSVAQE
ncbi:platelet glycoprotein Ib alpha chain [Pimephales promelas]|uniref:platelet glycoprotein Ib alpha chain n=1 Tax=Pimephales promelas TaxID=90988 RepID=UPI001955F129|nr:platelet glycoprotein Ib alpha chain [Pimephales promelas]